MFAFSAATLLLFGIELPRKLSLFSKLGDSSYSLYLFHPFLAPASLLVLARLTPQLHPVIQIAIAMALTIAAAHLLHLVVERPAVRIAKRLLPDARVTSKNAPERSPT